ATINNTAGNTAQVYQFVTETTAIVKQNGVVMSEVSSRIQEIYDTSSEMTAIIQVIDGIAFQTNILALNAAVEAARA
ncbi:methyl-accepting chemotaxis protein, partial [Enterobacter kobei]|nr:methyl-accepting chemotaxis protein [Enterobacter kobei]